MKISVSNIKVGICTHSGTYGTAANMSTTAGAVSARLSSLTYDATDNDIVPEVVGQASQASTIEKTSRAVNVSMSFDLGYNEAAIGICTAALLGTVNASGVVATVGQGDYVHSMALEGDSNRDITISFLKHADDEVIEFPTVTLTDMTVTADNVGRSTVTFNGIASNIVNDADAVNDATIVNALPLSSNYRLAVLGQGANCATHYFRLADRSTSVPLDSGDDMAITNFTATITRPLDPFYTLTACSSKNTKRPKQVGLIEGTLEVTLGEVDSAVYDALDKWDNAADLMAEVNIDGVDIGTGNPAGFKFQFPHLKPAAAAPALGFDSVSTLVQPTISFRLLTNGDISDASAGMTVPDDDSMIAVIITDVNENY
jgi:hypothetical protein